MFDLIRGPLVWASFIIFYLGTMAQVIRFYVLSARRADLKLGLKPHPEPEVIRGVSRFSRAYLLYRMEKIKLTIWGVKPVMVLVSFIFHVLLVLTPIFTLAHNELLDLSFTANFPSFPEALTDVLTIIVIMCALFFLGRRLFLKRVRSISTPYDYIMLLIAALPFISGFMAYHQFFDYKTTVVIHILAGELMLITLPFTKFVHMVFFIFNRFFIANEHTIGKGSRTW